VRRRASELGAEKMALLPRVRWCCHGRSWLAGVGGPCAWPIVCRKRPGFMKNSVRATSSCSCCWWCLPISFPLLVLPMTESPARALDVPR
jgi:hypothetical protein